MKLPIQLNIILIAFLSACAVIDREGFFKHDIVIPDQSGQVITVLGPIASENVGDTLMHEHISIQYYIPLQATERWAKFGVSPPQTEEELAVWNTQLTLENYADIVRQLDSGKFQNKDNGLLTPEDTLPEILSFKAMGGRTVVDLPPIEPIRKPLSLVRLSRESGVNIVAGTAFYTAPWHPKNIDRLSVARLTEFMLRDIVEGMDGTGVRAGIVGEVPAMDIRPSDPKSGETENNETRILRASARASYLTGAALSLHGPILTGDQAQQVIRVIEQEGLDLSRVIFGHVSMSTDVTLTELVVLLDKGLVLEFDNISNRNALQIGETVEQLISLGYEKQLLFSQDIFLKSHLTKFGGKGLTYIHKYFVPDLLSRGVSKVSIRQILQGNPQRLLTFDAPKADLQIDDGTGD